MKKVWITGALILVAVSLSAHPPGGGSAEDRERNLVDQFDNNHDGILNTQERTTARAFIKENPGRSSGGPGRGRGPGGPPGGGPPNSGTRRPNKPGPQVAPQDVANFDTDLYDEQTLRTLFLEFDTDDWEDELAAFYRTDIMVPAKLTVDEKTYPTVGVGFRGNSSYFTVSKGQKRSFNITMDYGNSKQDLYGYRTLNLLNSHSDPSFLREVVYNHIARQYTAAAQANFVKLVINGESWGVYGNAQQPNKDFTKEWFDSRGGVRWKVSPGPGSDGSALTYNGDRDDAYAGYQLKSKRTKNALPDLIRFCKILNETPTERLHEVLESVMSIDCALWFLALDNVLIDTDGYYSRGSDYMLYQHPDDGRFHVLTYDSNEVFRTPGHGGPPGGGRPGGGPPGGGRGGFFGGLFGGGPPPDRRGPPPEGGGRGREGGSRGDGPPGGNQEPQDLKLSPFAGEENERFALIHRLLANSVIRARYVAHVRTITEQWLDWQTTGPLMKKLHDQISGDVKADTRKLSSFDNFVKNLTDDIPGRRPTPGLKKFVDERGEYLRNHPDVTKPHPNIASVTQELNDGVTYVVAITNGDTKPNDVVLYHATARHLHFQQQPMLDDGQHHDGAANDGVYGAEMPDAGRICYYVEARTGGENPTTVFHPANTERGSIEYVPELVGV